jgi:cold shock CspA family protein/peroxiredoxin
MTTNLRLHDRFPDFDLPDHRFRRTRLSNLARHSPIDDRLGFRDGYPVIVVFYRGFFCPRDQRQMRLLVEFQDELAVNYAKLVAVAVQPLLVQAAFAAGLGAKWVFCADTDRALINQLNILDETEGEYANTAQPYTFVLRPDLTIHSIYNGWYFVGRPTLDELRRDLRAIMEMLSYYPYEVWNTPEVKAVRIPQSEWLDGAPPLGANGLAVASGVVTRFDLASGNGTIRADETGEDIFFNFTAIPGEGYRTISADTRVRFEIVDNATGRTARNIQADR